MIQYTKEEFNKFIKKAYVDVISEHVLELQKKVQQLEEENNSLKTEVETARKNYDKANNSLAMEIGTKMMDWMKKCTLSEHEVHNIVEEDVKRNLSVSTESEWVEYSGQGEHYHNTSCSWNGNVFDNQTN